jgi:hypothetical protein
VEAAEGGLSELGDAGEGDVDATGLVGNNSSNLWILRSISSRIATVRHQIWLDPNVRNIHTILDKSY